ncbi:extracellular solute-binding protein [Rhizobium sp. BK538]|uniref:ABC transporter substrate-binding protein n=1 Tax=Rhizobium sp. BK538 TaxID=2586984 RepID=UPI00160B9B8E|nr:extracellular solute-binding protein [Rhizobium sp. BK538]MBB4171573.1 iron(III) transport system substrate-binding protein [Rhizobium sp. BK538]
MIRNTIAFGLSACAFAAASMASAADKLVVYSALDTVESASKAFTQKTGIEVDLVRLSTGELLGKVAAEGNNPRFDVIWVEGSAVMSRLAQQGILKPEPGLADNADYTELGRKLVPESQAYFPVSVSTTAIAVNDSKLNGVTAPRSWTELAAFAGKVAAKDPNLSGPAFQWLAGYFEAKGVDAGKTELQSILTNKSLSGIPSGGAVNKSLITGDAALAIQQDNSIYALIDKKEPVSIVYPSDGVVAIPASAGIAAISKHEDQAKSFVEFLLTKDGETAMLKTEGGDGYFAPVIKGVTGRGARVDNTSTWKILDDKTAATNETEWKQWFRDQFVP